MKNALKGFEASDSFRRDVVKYIESCYMKDGGYFFAQVEPSGGLDTYCAVKSLSILGVKPGHPRAIANFFLDRFKTAAIVDIPGIFFAAEVLDELHRMSSSFKRYALVKLLAFRNDAGGFGAYQNIYIEIPSELRATYRAVRVLKVIGSDFDKDGIRQFTLKFLNEDGGYGGEGYSTVASTFYATEIYKIIEANIRNFTATKEFLRKREENRVQYIEDMYWLVMALANLGEKTGAPQKIAEFVTMCQRRNAGFARSTYGIPTLEYTFYALSILKEVGVL
jgi:hypothetical protein